MSLTNTTQMGNREGQEIKVYLYDDYVVDGTSNAPVMEIKNANSFEWDLKSEKVSATGGKYKSKKIDWDNPYEGTLTMNTQIISPQLLALQAGNELNPEGGIKSVKYSNKRNTKTQYFVITAETLLKDTSGELHAEDMIAYKASVNKGLTRKYEGDGDPQEISVVFDLLANDEDDVLEIFFPDEDEPIEP